MGKETKEKGKHRGKKITQFPTQSDVQEELEDAAMDRFLRQSIIEDADRIERELNEDPKADRDRSVRRPVRKDRGGAEDEGDLGRRERNEG